MTRDDIISMAMDAGCNRRGAGRDHFAFDTAALLRFADLVAAAEREACAAILDSVDNYANPMTAIDCADAIRARGKK